MFSTIDGTNIQTGHRYGYELNFELGRQIWVRCIDAPMTGHTAMCSYAAGDDATEVGQSV